MSAGTKRRQRRLARQVKAREQRIAALMVDKAVKSTLPNGYSIEQLVPMIAERSAKRKAKRFMMKFKTRQNKWP